MSDERTTRIVRRLKSVAGHIKGIEKMVEDDAYCVDVVHQIHAVQRALRKVSAAVLDRHLHHCVTRAISEGDDGDRERVLQELMDVFEATGKV
ncbi:MAG: metal-sensitive transcriptional regulator [Longimicrobiales bacterium]